MTLDAGLIETRGLAADTGGGGLRVDVLGCPVDSLDMDATVRRCLELIQADPPARQVSVNAAKVLQCASDPDLARFVAGSDLVNADGQAVVWASRVLGRPLPERIAGIDLMLELLRKCEERGMSVYILGAEERVLAKALGRLRQTFPRLRIAGAQHGYFTDQEEVGVAALIRGVAPDVLFVAMSSPRKEELIGRRLPELGARFVMGVGGAIDVIAGEQRRAPRWVQRLGLEWAARLIQEPRRLWRRYLVGNLLFAWLVARERFGRESAAPGKR